MNRPSAELALPEPRAARRAFDRAGRFDEACVVHDETRRRLLDRLDLVRLTPRVIVDLGCATGSGAIALTERYPGARVLAVDSSLGMLRAARARTASLSSVDVIGGDAERLPIAAHAVQLLFANLSLCWCRPNAVFGEAARVLDEGGLLLFATLGPDSLKEVRRAWLEVDDRVHVHAAFDMHDLGDLALGAGLAEPVVDVDRIEVTYADVAALVEDLRACGAVNVAAGRRRTLTGPRRWQAFERGLGAGRGAARLGVTLELVLGQAWGRGSRARSTGRDRAEIGVPVERIRRPASRRPVQ